MWSKKFSDQYLDCLPGPEWAFLAFFCFFDFFMAKKSMKIFQIQYLHVFSAITYSHHWHPQKRIEKIIVSLSVRPRIEHVAEKFMISNRISTKLGQVGQWCVLMYGFFICVVFPSAWSFLLRGFPFCMIFPSAWFSLPCGFPFSAVFPSVQFSFLGGFLFSFFHSFGFIPK